MNLLWWTIKSRLLAIVIDKEPQKSEGHAETRYQNQREDEECPKENS